MKVFIITTDLEDLTADDITQYLWQNIWQKKRGDYQMSVTEVEGVK